MGKKKREHVVFDQMRVQKKTIPFTLINQKKGKQKKPSGK